jgi:ADP-ribose pyrophosphatase
MEIDNPEELARGELREEIGQDAAEMTSLGMIWIAYGFTRQKQHVYLATGLTPAPGQRDAEEHDLIPRSFGIEEFEQMMLDGTIRDGCTLSAWGLYLMWKARR